MSKPNKKRTSASGQYVSPLLNELEWLDEEAEEKPISAAKKMPQPQARAPVRKTSNKAQTKKKKPGSTVKINVAEQLETQPPAGHRSTPPTQPLILLDKVQPHNPKAWVKRFFGMGPQSEEDHDAFEEAIQSFRLGLDGILKSGEELQLFPPRRRPIVIDVIDEPEQPLAEAALFSPQEVAAAELPLSEGPEREETEPLTEMETEPMAAAPTDSRPRELQQYGLIPYRFDTFDDWLDISISFEEPFADRHYTLVATTNQPGCYTVIREKESNCAVIRLIRDSLSPALDGELNWIALGEGESSAAAAPDRSHRE